MDEIPCCFLMKSLFHERKLIHVIGWQIPECYHRRLKASLISLLRVCTLVARTLMSNIKDSMVYCAMINMIRVQIFSV